ncbi:MAG: YbjN domain-containing protein [Bacillota bacterium]
MHFKQVTGYLERQGLVFEVVPGKTIAVLGFAGENGRWRVVADAIAPVNVPEGPRAAVAEYLTRANHNMTLGNFELDYSDGEVRYKTSTRVGSDALTDNMLEPLLFANLATMDRYLPGLMAVAFGNRSPAAAIAEAEK